MQCELCNTVGSKKRDLWGSARNMATQDGCIWFVPWFPEDRVFTNSLLKSANKILNRVLPVKAGFQPCMIGQVMISNPWQRWVTFKFTGPFSAVWSKVNSKHATPYSAKFKRCQASDHSANRHDHTLKSRCAPSASTEIVRSPAFPKHCRKTRAASSWKHASVKKLSCLNSTFPERERERDIYIYLCVCTYPF